MKSLKRSPKLVCPKDDTEVSESRAKMSIRSTNSDRSVTRMYKSVTAFKNKGKDIWNLLTFNKSNSL